MKCPKASESSKSSYWRLNANSLNRPYVRRRTCSLDTPGNGNGSVGGKKAKSRLGSSGAAPGGNSGSNAGKRSAAQMVGRDMKAAMYGDDLSAAAVRSQLSSLSSGIASAFNITGSGATGGPNCGLKGDPSGLLNHHHHNPWANSGFLSDRKMANDELSALW